MLKGVKEDFLTTFKKSKQSMIATNEAAYSSYGSIHFKSLYKKSYSEADVQKILESGGLKSQIELSRYYFERSGLYMRLVMYYATLLKYNGILIPYPTKGQKITQKFINKKYFEATNYLDNIPLKDFLTECARRVLVDGRYYGIKSNVNKNNFSIITLPALYCRSRFMDEKGNDVLEFDLTYFNTISDEKDRKQALEAYPSILSKEYNKYTKGKRSSSWVVIPASMGGVCFGFSGNNDRPIFVDIIESILNYEKAIETEQNRDKDEVKKIIVQRVPHLSDGTLLFEPPEAEEMHSAAVGMMKNNPNVSVLTTYNDVEAIVSKATGENTSSTMERMLNSIYHESGTSSQIFSSSNNMTLPTALKNDLSLMMILGNKFSRFVTDIINILFGNSNITFKYKILPVSYYNETEYIDEAFKLASSGYSILAPAIAGDFSQGELLNLKDLENNLLKLDEKLIPLSSSYTQSTNEGGRPTLDPEDKSEKTEKNEESLGKQGE